MIVSAREQHRDRLGAQPASAEQQGLGGRGVEPLEIVDQAEDESVLRCQRQHAQRCRTDEESVDAGRLAQAQDPGERIGLALGQLIEPVGERPQQAIQPRECQVRLRLHPGGAQDRAGAGAAAAYASSALLPTPGAPRTTSDRLSPPLAASSIRSMASRSRSRPTKPTAGSSAGPAAVPIPGVVTGNRKRALTGAPDW